MSLFDVLTGTINTFFQIGGPAYARLKALLTGQLELRTSDDTAYANFRAAHPLIDNDVATKLYVDSANGAVLISGQFNGGSALPANTSTRRFLVVTTSGATASIGQLLFDDGSGTGNMVVISALEGRLIVVTQALTGGTATFAADSIYVWDAQGGTWVLSGDVAGYTGAERVIKMTLNNAASQSSASQIPANATILRTIVLVTTPFSAGATLTLGRSGQATLLRSATDSVLQTAASYRNDEPKSWGASATTVLATIGNAPSVGAAEVYITFSVPNNLWPS